jgi:hypothetical protein
MPGDISWVASTLPITPQDFQFNLPATLQIIEIHFILSDIFSKKLSSILQISDKMIRINGLDKVIFFQK